MRRRRYFFHSFPRRRQGEAQTTYFTRALQILAFMREAGLVLAPEVVEWDITALGHAIKSLRLMQRRASFTELARGELRTHMQSFGPISLGFDITALREHGLMPVLYSPQSLSTATSLVSVFATNAAWHTKGVLAQLQQLKTTVQDPRLVANATATLNNTDGSGNIVASYTLPTSNIDQILKHVQFNNIPFDHSIGMLNILLGLFLPTDNTHTSEILGYYRQREWRFVAGDLDINGRPMARELTSVEKARLTEIDSTFWTKQIEFDGNTRPRHDWALIYDPSENWRFFDLVREVIAPAEIKHEVQAILSGTSATLSTRRFANRRSAS